MKSLRWIEFGERGKRGNIPSVFLSHIFVNGGKASDSERGIDLGGARLIGAEQIPDCDYAALGHLHRAQKLTDRNIYYSGSVMRFSFDEFDCEKWVNVFDLTQKGMENFRRIRLNEIKNLVRLHANSADDGIALLKKNEDCYAELTMNLDEPLTPEESSALHGCKNLISLKCDVKSVAQDLRVKIDSSKSASVLFDEFYKSRFGCEPPDKLKALFLSLTEEE